MARINCEDDYWTDPRREALGLLLKDQEKADGRMLRAWRIAQSHWKQGGLIPKPIWDAARLDGVLECGLAEVRGDAVYCKGSEHHFEWVSKRSEAGRIGGRASAESRREKYGNAVPNNARNKKHSTEALPKQTFDASVNLPNDHRSTTEASSHLISSQLKEHTSNKPEAIQPAYAIRTADVRDTYASRSLRTNERRLPPTTHPLVDLWNQTVKRLPKARLTKKRAAQIKARLAETPDLEYWQKIIGRLDASDFAAAGGWASLAWLIKNDENHVKVSEGAYDNRPTASPKTRPVLMLTLEDLDAKPKRD